MSLQDKESLELLLRAPSRAALTAFFSAIFRGRSGPASETLASRNVAALSLGEEETVRLVEVSRALVSSLLYDSASILAADGGGAAASVASRLPAGLEPRLAALLAAELAAALPLWREAAIEARTGPPRLRGAAWQVAVADGSDKQARFGTAIVSLVLAVQDGAASRSSLPPAERSLRVELNHASLAALVDGMRKVAQDLDTMS